MSRRPTNPGARNPFLPTNGPGNQQPQPAVNPFLPTNGPSANQGARSTGPNREVRLEDLFSQRHINEVRESHRGATNAVATPAARSSAVNSFQTITNRAVNPEERSHKPDDLGEYNMNSLHGNRLTEVTNPFDRRIVASYRKLLVWNNCDAETRCGSWMGARRPPSGRNRGCAVNVMRWLESMDEEDATETLKKNEEGKKFETGIPFSYFLEKFNSPEWIEIILRNNGGRPPKYRVSIDETKYPFITADDVEQFYGILQRNMPNNSCVVVRLNRRHAMALLRIPVGDYTGHWFVITKTSDGTMVAIEPHYSPNAGECKFKVLTLPISENYIRMNNELRYETVSIFTALYKYEASLSGGRSPEYSPEDDEIEINGSIMLPEIIKDTIENALFNSIECTNEPSFSYQGSVGKKAASVGGKKTKKAKKEKKKKRIRKSRRMTKR